MPEDCRSAPVAPDDRPDETELPPAVVALRKAADAQAQLMGSEINSLVEAVLENCRIALDALAIRHAHLADNSDLDLNGDTRWAARWQLAGVAIAYAHAL